MNTKKTLIIISITTIIFLSVAGIIEHTYFMYKNDNAPISYTQWMIEGHYNDKYDDSLQDPSSENYRGW